MDLSFPDAAASAMGTPAFSSGSELQGRSHGLHPHIVNGLALAHCSTSSHLTCGLELSSGHTFDSPCIRAAQVRALGVWSSSSSSSSSSKAATQTVRSEDRTTAAADEQALAKLQLARCAFACDFGLTGLAPRPRSISVSHEPDNFPVFSLSPY